MMLDLTGWGLIFFILVVFAPWFIMGAVLGFVLSYVSMSRSVRGGGRAPKSLLAALVGGTLGVLSGLLVAS